jgi:iron complex outermembrane recepter protein
MKWWKNNFTSSSQYAGKNMPATEDDEREFFLGSVLFSLVVISIFLLLIKPLPLMAESTSHHNKTPFDIPQLWADLALTKFAEQADLTLIFPFKEARDKTANRLAGNYPIEEALYILLAGTGLKATVDDSGQITIESEKTLGRKKVMHIRKKLPSAIFAALASVFGHQAVVAAQTTEGDIVLEEVVVTGSYRKSLEKALDMKRNKIGFVDAIVATDIAAFPDQNLAEALQRIPGVAIDRVDGRGKRVNVRSLGSQFTYATVNGIDASAGTGERATGFEVFSSDLIQSVSVKKSPTASDIEGGVAAVVAIRTPRAFDYHGRKILVSTEAAYNTKSEEVDPRISLMFSNTFADDTFGVLVGYSFEDRTARTDKFESPGWNNMSRYGSADDPLPAGVDPDWIVSTGTHSRITASEQNTEGALFAVEYRPVDNLQLGADLWMGSYEQKNTEYKNETKWDSGTPVTNATVDANGVANSISFADSKNELSSKKTDKKNEYMQFSFTADWQFDDWNIGALIGLVDAEEDEPITAFKWQGFGSSSMTLAGDNVINRSFADSNIETNADLYDFLQFEKQHRFKEDDRSAFQLDFERQMGLIWVDSVKFGVRYNSSTIQRNRYRTTFKDIDGNAADDGAVPVEDLVSGGSDFFSGYSGNLTPGTWLAVPIDNAFASYDDPSYVAALDPGWYFKIGEDVTALYAESDLSFDIGSFPARMNVGARYVDTQQESGGYLRDRDNALDTKQTIDHSYDDWLPSLSMDVNLTEELIVRFAAAKVMTRASLDKLSGSLDVRESEQKLSAGNPRLEPLRADQVDLSVEYYFAPESLLSLAYFRKDLKSYFTGKETSGVIYSGEEYTLTTTVNAEGAKIEGLEFIYQQPFVFLPSPFDGFGVNFNYTYVDSEAGTETDSGRKLPLNGLSKNSFNAVLYYEKSGFDMRVSYNYKSESFAGTVGPEGVRWVDDYAQFDLSAGYQVNDSLKVTLKALNITNELTNHSTEFNGTHYPWRFFDYGRRINLGARFSF